MGVKMTHYVMIGFGIEPEDFYDLPHETQDDILDGVC